MDLETWTVVGGEGHDRIARPCNSREEAEDWAHKLIAAGIVPVKINGELFEPAGAEEARERQVTTTDP